MKMKPSEVSEIIRTQIEQYNVTTKTAQRRVPWLHRSGDSPYYQRNQGVRLSRWQKDGCGRGDHRNRRHHRRY